MRIVSIGTGKVFERDPRLVPILLLDSAEIRFPVFLAHENLRGVLFLSRLKNIPNILEGIYY